MITRLVIYAFIVGATFGLVIPAAIRWARDLGLRMTWWKWLMAAAWYLFLLFSILLAFTFIGEGEVIPGWKLPALLIVLEAVAGAVLAWVFWRGRET
ncbi:MAG TPA: hypothetical protein ENN40_10535 [Candidatus Aminicenantes bacterium]|nr:hypothetical protein [Candidatus Aminicenantes bacterium]